MALSADQIITNPPPGVDLTLVGGQALAFWTQLGVQRYPHLFPDDIISSTYDIDFVVGLKTACKICHEHWGGELFEVNSMDDHTPELGIINIKDGDNIIAIDLLDGLLSMDYSEICKYRVSLGSSESIFKDMYILTEWGVLLNRVYNSCSSIRRYRNPEAIKQLRNAVAINAAYIQSKLDHNDIKAAQKQCNKLLMLACNKAGLAIFLDCGVDLLDALPGSFEGFISVEKGLNSLIAKVNARREVRLVEREKRRLSKSRKRG
jgi:hypothetical protein